MKECKKNKQETIGQILSKTDIESTKILQKYEILIEGEIPKKYRKVRKLKKTYFIKGKVKDGGKPHDPISKTRQLKFYIISFVNNKELGNHCRHQKKLLHCSIL